MSVLLPPQLYRALAALIIVTAAARVQAFQEQPPTPVRAEAVRMELVQDKRMVTGNVRALRDSEIATEEPGIVESMLVREGQLVNEGDLLVTLRNSRLQLEMERLKAQRGAFEALLRQRSESIAQARRDLSLLQASFERQAANERELADARTAVAIAEAVESETQSEIAAIDAQIALLDERIDDTRILAPFDGVVVAKHIDVGEWLAEGDPLIRLLATSHVEAWLDVPQRYVSAAESLAELIPLRIEATDEIIEALDRRVIPNVDPRSRTFVLILPLDNSARRLAPGMSVTAWVPTDQQRERLTVPKNAVLRNEAGPFVYVVRGGDDEQPGNAAPAQLEVLYPIGDRYVIRSSAMRPGDLVVTEGNERLFPMMPVVPVLSEAAPQPGQNEAVPQE